jgi:hypothetical protein
MFVLTVDQVRSRERVDLVGPTLDTLATLPTRLPFTRTVGDEFQGALENAPSVVDAILTLMRNGKWHIGLGIGAVEEPLPEDPRSARGPAFLAARTAVDRAKQEPTHVSVVAEGPGALDAEDVEVVLQLLATLRSRRTDQGWEAADLMSASGSRTEVAAQLGVSRQAVGQRLQAAAWTVEQRARATLVRLLDRADAAAADRSEAS